LSDLKILDLKRLFLGKSSFRFYSYLSTIPFLIIRYSASKPIFFGYRAGRPMTEDRRIPQSSVSKHFHFAKRVTGKKADIHYSF